LGQEKPIGHPDRGPDFEGMICCKCGSFNWLVPTNNVESTKHSGLVEPTEKEWICPVCEKIETGPKAEELECSQCKFVQVNFSKESGLKGKRWSAAGLRCPLCGDKAPQKTMAAMAAAVEKRLWDNLPEKVEKLLEKELGDLDRLLGTVKKPLAKAGLIAVRASIKSKAVSRILAARVAKS
jgi:hypothetical protein